VSDPPAPAPPGLPADPFAIVRTRSYAVLLVISAIVGAPVAAAAYYFLQWVNDVQKYIFTTLPNDLGFHGEPPWWPLVPLAVCGLIVALIIRYLPGTAGHEPSDGFQSSGSPLPVELPGIILAAFATLGLGAVLGPEAPMIALGSGLAVLAVRLLKRDLPARAFVVIGAAGSFAAISTLLGSPIVGAFLLMEIAGLGGPLLGVVLVPGLLAAGIGSLIFVGLYDWTGHGTFTLAIPHIPAVGPPTGAEFLWAIGIGVAAAALGFLILRAARILRRIVESRRVPVTPLIGLAVAGFAIAFDQATGRGTSPVLFSGETALAPLVQNAATWTAGALVLLALFKGLAYTASLSGFRGGPTFPAMFIGAAAGIALSHGPGLPMIAGVGMGIGAMTVAVLRLPLTSVMLASLFLQADAVNLMPIVIVAVVVAYVVSYWLAPPASPAVAPEAPDASRSEAAVGALTENR
jgi:H+/Cl- antiporter ClcA